MPPPAYRPFVAGTCVFFVISLYVKLRELLLTQEYRDALHLSGTRARVAHAWFSIVFSRDEALLFLALLGASALAWQVVPSPGRAGRVILRIAYAWLPAFSVLEVFGLSYYATYQTPFPAADLVFARWARELLVTANPLASSRIVIGVVAIVAGYPAAAIAARRLHDVTWRLTLRALSAAALAMVICGFTAPRPVLAGSLLAPHPVVFFFTGHRPSFANLPPDEILAPVGPTRRAYDPQPRPKNLILLILESTPARSVFAYAPGADAGRRLFTTFGDDATVFDAVYSPAPFSARAFYSVAFGERSWIDPAATVNQQTLAEVLKARGFRTEMYLNADSQIAGFAEPARRGLDRFLDVTAWPGQERYARLLWGRDDRMLFDEMRRFVDTHEHDTQPFLLVAGTSNPHAPYELNKIPGGRAGLPDAQAHAALVARDLDLLTDFYAHLSASTLGASTALLAFGDHGEAFDEHPDNIIHSKNLYDENVRVACFLLGPHRFGLPPRIHQLGSLQDIKATALDLLGVDAAAGHSLSLLFDAPERIVFSATDYGPGQVALRSSRFTYIQWPTTGVEALFDRISDPEEHMNVAGRYPAVVARFRTRLPAITPAH